MEINSFSGQYRFLSNFYPARVSFEGLEYPTVEHAYQAAKTLDLEKRAEISKLSKPGEAKRAGKKLTLRPDWESVKIDVMTSLVSRKFRDHPELALKLLGTGNATLIEGNTWNDTFWGICNGIGQNHLGLILMRVRAALA